MIDASVQRRLRIAAKRPTNPDTDVAINEFLRTRNIYPEEIKTTVHEMNITQSRESIADWLSARGL